LGLERFYQTISGRLAMRRKKVFFAWVVFMFAAFLTNHESVKAQEVQKCKSPECNVIRFYKDLEKTVRIEPETLYASKGDCIIWVNWSPNQKVYVTFEEGKRCQDIVDASADFKINSQGCFIADLILPRGGTASLVFKKEGTYDYVATPVDGDKIKGKIVVQ